MKLLVCDGRDLKVYDLGPLVMQVSARANGPPIKLNGHRVLSDEAARGTVRAILWIGCYDNVRVE